MLAVRGLPTCGAVDEDEGGWVGEASERVGDPGECLGSKRQGQLGARLGEAEEVEVVERAVSDERLVEAAVPGEDVGGGEVDAVLEAEQEVEVAEAGVGVDGDGGEGEAREGGGEVGGGGGLADAALAGRDDDDPRGGARELRGRAPPVVARGDGRRGGGAGRDRRGEGQERHRAASLGFLLFVFLFFKAFFFFFLGGLTLSQSAHS